jgi:CO/xanthine dehydrogenase FAD-binding subunit
LTRYVKIKTLSELIERIQDKQAQILCGGTDLMVKMSSGIIHSQFLLDISDTEELRGIDGCDDHIAIGAATTISEVLANELVADKLPLLRKVLCTIGSTQIRNRATLGGNLVNASPAADSAIPLLLHEASVDITGTNGNRRMLIEDLLLGPGKTALNTDEVITRILIPLPTAPFGSFFHKVGRRKAMVIAIASLGALFKVEDGRINEIRLAAGSVAPRPIRMRALEGQLAGQAITKALIEQAKGTAANAVSPIDDVRASSAYRRDVISELVARVVSLAESS